MHAFGAEVAKSLEKQLLFNLLDGLDRVVLLDRLVTLVGAFAREKIGIFIK